MRFLFFATLGVDKGGGACGLYNEQKMSHEAIQFMSQYLEAQLLLNDPSLFAKLEQTCRICTRRALSHNSQEKKRLQNGFDLILGSSEVTDGAGG